MRFQLLESVKSIDGDVSICTYIGNVKDILLNKPNNYRILYVPSEDVYLIGDSWTNTHPDLLDVAIKYGYCNHVDDLYEFVENQCVRYIFVPNENPLVDDLDELGVHFSTFPTGELYINEEDLSRVPTNCFER